MLDIKALRLTDEERDEIFDADDWQGAMRIAVRMVADAQLEKALQGTQEWLTHEAKTREEMYLKVGGIRAPITAIEGLAHVLATVLETAGTPGDYSLGAGSRQ